MKKFFKEFKAFISKGNVFDMAVGLIIATAFNKIVSSMVNDIIMPLVTWGTGAASLADLSVTLRTTVDPVTEEVVKLTWNYGSFLQTVTDFLIIALSVFIMVKLVTASQRKFKEISNEIVENIKELSSAEKKELKARAKAEGRNYKQLLAEVEVEKAKVIEAEKERLALEETNKPKPVTEMDVLTEIRDLLKAEQKGDSKLIEKATKPKTNNKKSAK